MTPRKLNVSFFIYSYGGNGGAKSEHPDIREWLLPTVIKMKADPRIGEIRQHTLADTPITLTRNKSVLMARAEGADVIVMIDSDMTPDVHLGRDGSARPFWDTSFDFLYNHYDKGPVVIGAPYCGPPGGTENVYVFHWEDLGSHRGRETPFTIQAYTRTQSFYMAGVQECAALPTGLIMYDMRAFELIEPSKLSQSEVLDSLLMGKLTKSEAMAALRRGFFDYEWKDGYAAEKASTEDVQNTRDISLAGEQVLGYNPVYCNWDAWAGHNKFWCVGKPTLHCAENVSANLAHAVENKDSIYKRVMRVDTPIEFERHFTADDQPLTVSVPDHPSHSNAIAQDFARIRSQAEGHEKYKRDYPEAHARASRLGTLQAVDSQSQAIVGQPQLVNFDGRTTEG
jgi:hypothetical protein